MNGTAEIRARCAQVLDGVVESVHHVGTWGSVRGVETVFMKMFVEAVIVHLAYRSGAVEVEAEESDGSREMGYGTVELGKLTHVDGLGVVVPFRRKRPIVCLNVAVDTSGLRRRGISLEW